MRESGSRRPGDGRQLSLQCIELGQDFVDVDCAGGIGSRHTTGGRYCACNSLSDGRARRDGRDHALATGGGFRSLNYCCADVGIATCHHICTIASACNCPLAAARASIDGCVLVRRANVSTLSLTVAGNRSRRQRDRGVTVSLCTSYRSRRVLITCGLSRRSRPIQSSGGWRHTDLKSR